jgi:regulatory protein YycH of two-component signal transduction system YycFG
MSLMNKVLLTIALFFVMIFTGMGLYIEHLQKRANKLQKENQIQKILLIREREKADKELYMCKKDMELMKKFSSIEKNTNKEIKHKIKKEKDYEILASDKSCGCVFDGTGWVFK